MVPHRAVSCPEVPTTRRLADGLYEDVVTNGLADALELVAHRRHVDVAALGADAHVILARFLRGPIERALADVGGSGDDKLARQVQLADDLLRVLEVRKLIDREQLLASPARELRGVFPDPAARPRRPETPLAATTLLTLGHGEPRIGHELACEIDSTDRVDALVSFVTKGGVRVLRDAIDRLVLRYQAGGPPVFRLLTTTYTGATEASAVEELARLPGVEVRISYDGRRTRLHAKAWLFHRESGLTTAYVGSANLSSPALTAGLEWMVKLAGSDLPHVIAKFSGAFETLWADGEFQRFDPDNPSDRERLRGALGAARGTDDAARLTFFTIRPYEFQEEILDRLRAEREIHGRYRNLVVAATGTGKTVIAAFDYARRASASGILPRLLFLAHRRELLDQARDTFRHVLRDASFGALLTGNDEPHQLDHLFATIASLRSRGLIDRLGSAYWDHVVVDECHHVPAASYQDVVPHLAPRVLVGLTATPERSDGQSLLVDFDGHVAAEVRLWHALERQLLVPFEYYGIHDGIDERRMASLRWTRGKGYDAAALDGLYTGDDARAAIVLAQLRRRVSDIRDVRALGFCVGIGHAEFMAAHFTRHGVPAIALHGQSPSDLRDRGRHMLERAEVHVIFTADLYNEGVDLPFVDTLLLLRPTESATLFLQQLGRGLRLHTGKACCLVLDFIGQHRQEFRFDAVLGALTGLPRGRLIEATEHGFPFLPSGCSMVLDEVARDTVLRSLRTAVEARWPVLVAEAQAIARASQGKPVTLSTFLRESGRDLDEIYRRGSWTALAREARLREVMANDEVLEACQRLGRLVHIDDPGRLQRIQRLLDGRDPVSPIERREALMLGYQIEHEPRRFMAAEGVGSWLRDRPPVCDELRELAGILSERVSAPASLVPVSDWPLVVHRHYMRREILTACGYWTDAKKTPQQQGVLRMTDQHRELLFVTLDKSDRGFSPTTRYRDFAISRDEFHWETQNGVSAESETARRYADHVARGWSIHLFVQSEKGAPFAYLGPVRHARSEGSKPVAIVWRLEHSLPAALFQQYATLAGG
jgi:superfamily II DNA or RNA helicase/HKD family nuclease